MVVHVQPHKAQSLSQHRDYATITRLPREIAFKHRILIAVIPETRRAEGEFTMTARTR